MDGFGGVDIRCTLFVHCLLLLSPYLTKQQEKFNASDSSLVLVFKVSGSKEYIINC